MSERNTTDICNEHDRYLKRTQEISETKVSNIYLIFLSICDIPFDLWVYVDRQ